MARRSPRPRMMDTVAGQRRRMSRRCQRSFRPLYLPTLALMSSTRGAPTERRMHHRRASATRFDAGRRRPRKRSRRSCARHPESGRPSMPTWCTRSTSEGVAQACEPRRGQLMDCLPTMTSLRAKIPRPSRSQCRSLHQACQGASAKHTRVSAESA